MTLISRGCAIIFSQASIAVRPRHGNVPAGADFRVERRRSSFSKTVEMVKKMLAFGACSAIIEQVRGQF
jgi:hypothetical protein